MLDESEDPVAKAFVQEKDDEALYRDYKDKLLKEKYKIKRL